MQPDTIGDTGLRQRGSESKGSTSRWPKTSSQPETQDTKADESVDSKAEVQPRGGKSSEVSLATRDKTTESSTEVSLKTVRDKTETTEVTVTARDRKEDGGGTVQILTSGVTGSEYQQIVSSLMDMRVDLKLEIQRLNLKVSRIDEHLVELVKKMPRLPSVEDAVDRTAVESYRRVSDHSTKHSSTTKGGKGHHSSGPSKKKGPKSKSWTSPKSPTSPKAPPNDSAVRAMLENEIEELHKESLPNETQ